MPYKLSNELINPSSLQINENFELLAEMPITLHTETKQILNWFNQCQLTVLSNPFLAGFKVVTKLIYTKNGMETPLWQISYLAYNIVSEF